MEFSSNVFRVGTQTTGAGTVRDLGLIRGGAYKLYIGSSEATIYQRLVPSSDASYSLGKDSRRWSEVCSVDGSFSGNLTSEVGGSIRAYQLGTDGDTDSRYLEVSDYGIQQVKTGAAGNQAWYIGSNLTGAGIEFSANGSQIILESNFGQNIRGS